MFMNTEARVLIETVMDMINGTLEHYERDPHHAPASWLLENWWCTLNAALQVRDHADSKPYSFEAADKTESEKGHEDVQPDE
jgi:hypothetical protein